MLDTSKYDDELMGKFVSDVILNVLSFVADNERKNIKQRQMEGIKIAIDKGVRFGRSSNKYPENFCDVYNDWKNRKIKAVDTFVMPTKKIIHVVAAIIHEDNKILATQRGYGEYKDGWEFPGGKVEEGEAPQDALVREIKEELGVQIRVEDHIETVEYDYPEFHLSMECYWSTIIKGRPILYEHEALKWINKNELYSIEWLPADKVVVNRIKNNACFIEIIEKS